MKKFANAEVVELEIEATAYGRNMHAVEANANKHPNKGVGGRLPEEEDATKAPDDASL